MEARGMTLIEVLVGLGLVAILGAVAMWNARAWTPDTRLDAAARQVVLDLRLARTRAIAERVTRRVVFAPDSNTYRNQRRPAGTYMDDGLAVALPGGIDLVTCTAVGNAVTFAPRGTVSTFGTITLRNGTGRERRVIVDIAGRIRVQ